RRIGVREGGHRPVEGAPLGGADRGGGPTQRVPFGHRECSGRRAGDRAGGVVAENGSNGEGAFVGVGVRPADGEGAAAPRDGEGGLVSVGVRPGDRERAGAAGDGAGGGGAVAPVDGGREVGRGVPRVRVAECGYGAAEGRPLGGADRRGRRAQRVTFGHGGG